METKILFRPRRWGWPIFYLGAYPYTVPRYVRRAAAIWWVQLRLSGTRRKDVFVGDLVFSRCVVVNTNNLRRELERTLITLRPHSRQQRLALRAIRWLREQGSSAQRGADLCIPEGAYIDLVS